MSAIWKIIRIAALYVVFFFVSVMISAVALDSLPDTFEALFALFAPVGFIWLYERRRAAKIAAMSTASGQLEADETRTVSEGMSADGPRTKLPDRLRQSRTQVLRERLFGDNSSVFDPKNSDRVRAIAARASKASTTESLPGQLADNAPTQHYRRNQDYSELIRVGRAAREALEAASHRRAAEKQAAAQQREESSPIRSPLKTKAADQGLNRAPRIQEAGEEFRGDIRHLGPSTHERLPERKAVSGEASFSRNVQGWVRKGQTVSIAGRQIDGMVYVGAPPEVDSYGYGYGEKCRAYIDPSLPVAPFSSDKNGDGMSYWPGYSTIPAACRATYLDWLAGGRMDGRIGAGYAFLFFYGLERRFLVDQPSDDEKQEIVAEVQRLKALFPQNYSVQRYLGEFLDIARIVAMGGISLDDPALKQSIIENRSWDLPVSLKFALGRIIAEGKALDAEWLYLWFLCHPERRLRTPAERCSEEFKALFKLKFDAQWPDGLKVRTPRKLLTMNYRSACSEFNCSVKLTSGERGAVAIPDVTDLRSPVQKAQEIADEAMDELDKFSRYLGRNADARGSIEAQALLPAELWGLFPSDELEELKGWACEKVAGGGLVPAVEVIARLEGNSPDKIGKRQLTGAADALARIGFGLAPDPRFSFRGPKVDEPVVIFELGEPVEQLEDVSPAYRSQLFELALASFVAHSDRKIVEAERRALSEKVEAANGVTELERKRLHANLEWYLGVPPDMSWLRSRLKEADAEHHLALRAAVVAIAHADSIIHSQEVATIEKVYTALGLDAGLVYADLHAGDVLDGPIRVKAAEPEIAGERIPDEPRSKSQSLDAARIAAIRTDTQRVSTVLGEIFSADEYAEAEALLRHDLTSSFAGLDLKHAVLVEQIIRREHWTEAEFDEVAANQGLMPSGALEAINEWAFEKFYESLLDEYEGYDVAPEIAAALQAELAKKGN